VAGQSAVSVRRSAERFTTVGDGVRTRHILSFGGHYDPALTAFGPLIAHNDEVAEPGSGYAPHRHRGVEILTWVVAGRLVHRDPAGETVLGPGSAQLLSAGSGVTHEEMGGSMESWAAPLDDDPLTAPRPLGATRFIQMWLAADSSEPPRHQAAQFDDAELRSRLVPIVAGRSASDDRGSQSTLELRTPGVACHAGRIAVGATRTLPAAGGVHLFVIGGAVAITGVGADISLDGGDSALLTECRAAECVGRSDAEIVVWGWES
jgi:redox-sensitive bicupin YhaK (pirin superfamily)